MAVNTGVTTEILTIRPELIRKEAFGSGLGNAPNDWGLSLPEDSKEAQYLQRAARELREGSIPVAFPTETVYGLGADATRSEAVQGIYKAKQRPSDNPLIVHFHSLDQIRDILRPSTASTANGQVHADPIPAIYKPLIEKYWPGPLTLLMPNPRGSRLAPEVTAGLPTFGARMPKNLLALALIKMADRPLAAPSANASTKPSPTAAAHVKHDLDGRISTILDGGPCDVGVESTVVDGLCSPPVILRPGGITLEELRSCPGWENVQVAYKDAAQAESAPRAPGMKYKHYSPRAPVVLYEIGSEPPSFNDLTKLSGVNQQKTVGIIRTSRWASGCGLKKPQSNGETVSTKAREVGLPADEGTVEFQEHEIAEPSTGRMITMLDISIGPSSQSAARGLFSALRLLDSHGVDAILVEGIDDGAGDVATAVMNRLRKAAEMKVVAATPGHG